MAMSQFPNQILTQSLLDPCVCFALACSSITVLPNKKQDTPLSPQPSHTQMCTWAFRHTCTHINSKHRWARAVPHVIICRQGGIFCVLTACRSRWALRKRTKPQTAWGWLSMLSGTQKPGNVAVALGLYNWYTCPSVFHTDPFAKEHLCICRGFWGWFQDRQFPLGIQCCPGELWV